LVLHAFAGVHVDGSVCNMRSVVTDGSGVGRARGSEGSFVALALLSWGSALEATAAGADGWCHNRPRCHNVAWGHHSRRGQNSRRGYNSQRGQNSRPGHNSTWGGWFHSRHPQNWCTGAVGAVAAKAAGNRGPVRGDGVASRYRRGRSRGSNGRRRGHNNRGGGGKWRGSRHRVCNRVDCWQWQWHGRSRGSGHGGHPQRWRRGAFRSAIEQDFGDGGERSNLAVTEWGQGGAEGGVLQSVHNVTSASEDKVDGGGG
jgi:hypothetical protein